MMKQTKALRDIQQEVRDFVGPARLAELHGQNAALDLLAVVLPVAAFLAILRWVSSPALGPLAQAALVVTQGWLMTIMALVNHDLFVHRRRYGGHAGWLVSSMLFGLLTIRATAYGVTHLRHHGKIGTEEDPENYKQDINSLGRRLLFVTLPGVKLATSGRWSTDGRRGYLRFKPPSEQIRWRLHAEGLVTAAIIAGFVGYGFFDFKAFLLGYLLPLLVMAPALNSLRIIIEHAELDPENPYALATSYETGLLSKVFFLADSGDCHLVHHVFPRIPFYRMSAALETFAPFFEAKGVLKRVSYLGLLKGWFVKNYAHRTVWPT
jgi:fatty acid desaturase